MQKGGSTKEVAIKTILDATEDNTKGLLTLHLFDVDDCAVTTGAQKMDKDAIELFDNILKNSKSKTEIGICSSSMAGKIVADNFRTIKGAFSEISLSEEEQKSNKEDYKKYFKIDLNSGLNNKKEDLILKHYLYHTKIKKHQGPIRIIYYDNEFGNLKQVENSKKLQDIPNLKINCIPMSSMPAPGLNTKRQDIRGTITTKALNSNLKEKLANKKIEETDDDLDVVTTTNLTLHQKQIEEYKEKIKQNIKKIKSNREAFLSNFNPQYEKDWLFLKIEEGLRKPQYQKTIIPPKNLQSGYSSRASEQKIRRNYPHIHSRMENIVTKIKNVKMNSTGSQFHFTVNTGHINNRNINDSYSIKLDKSGSEINYRGK